MGVLMDSFNRNFEKVTGLTVDEARQSLKNQREVSGRSGNNITMGDKMVPITGLGERYKNMYKDIIKFFQDEFKVTPRANIVFNPDELDENVYGLSYVKPDKTGQHTVDLKFFTDNEAAEDEKLSKEQDELGWHPKGAGTIAGTPVHELGHVLSFQLFPSKQKIYKLYVDSLRDVGTDLTSREDTIKNTAKLSGYATADPYEAIAEALTDYYHNRDKSTDLTKAIVKRMKNKGSMYGITQSGGVAGPNETFMQNLRRYSAIQ